MPTDAEIVARAYALWSAVAAARDLYDASEGSGAYTAALTEWCDWARALADSSVFGSEHLDALANLIAHIAYRLDPGGFIGSGTVFGAGVVSVKTGQLSVSVGGSGGSLVATGSTADAQLGLTPPGAAFLALRDTRGVIAAPFAVF